MLYNVSTKNRSRLRHLNPQDVDIPIEFVSGMSIAALRAALSFSTSKSSTAGKEETSCSIHLSETIKGRGKSEKIGFGAVTRNGARFCRRWKCQSYQ
jgi:hypothetical protein